VSASTCVQWIAALQIIKFSFTKQRRNRTRKPAEQTVNHRNESRTKRTRVMSQRRRVQKSWLGLVAAGSLSLSTWTGVEARPLGLFLGGGLHHLGGFGGGLHHFGGFGGGFRPPGGGFRGGPFGFRQAGRGYSGFRQAGLGYRGVGSVGESRRGRGGSGRGRYWGATGAAAAVGAMGAYSNGYATTDSDNSGYPAYGYYGYPAYGN
jgi:hypothetical protein